MPCGLGVLPDVTRQQPRCPKLVRISQLLGLLAGQRHHPCAGAVRDCWLLTRPRAVIKGRHHAKPYRTIKASLHSLVGHADRFANCIRRWVDAIGQENSRPLNPTGPFRSRPRNRLQLDQVSRFNRDLDFLPRCRHHTRRDACVLVSYQATTCKAASGIRHNWSVPRNRCTSRQTASRGIDPKY